MNSLSQTLFLQMRNKPAARITMEVQTPAIALMIVPELDATRIEKYQLIAKFDKLRTYS